MARLSSDLVLTLHDKVSGPARGVGHALDAIDRRVSRSGRMAAESATGIMRAETALLARTGAALAPAAALYGGAQAFTQYADVERQLTRTGLKLGATRETMKAVRSDMQAIAEKYAVPIEQVMASFDSLAESGFELGEARASLDGMVKATQGLGGSGQDTVATFDAARKSIGLAAADTEKFFDIIAAGGSMGKFEGSDLARYLPSLLPVAARQGYEGLEGAARLVGFLEVMRDFVGSSEEAATATADIFEKISSPDVIKNFAKVGIDLEKRLAAARENGEDVLAVMSDIIREATGGDATKLSQLFGDRDSRRAANVLLTQYARVKAAQDALLKNSGGTIDYNVKIVTEDAQASIDKLSNSWDSFVQNVGAGVSTVAVPALDWANQNISDTAALEKGYDKTRIDGESNYAVNRDFESRYREQNPDAGADAFMPWGEGRKAQDEALIKLGRGEVETIYDSLNAQRAANNRTAEDVAFAARAAADRSTKWREYIAKDNLDGEPVRKGAPLTEGGAPLPRSRNAPETLAMSEQDQRGEYDRGRRAGEAAMRDRRENMSGRDALDGIVDRNDRLGDASAAERESPAPPPAAPRRPDALDLAVPPRVPAATPAPPSTPSTAPTVSAREADTDSMAALVRQFGAIMDRSGGFQAGITGTEVRDEAGVTPMSKPEVDTTAIDGAKAKAAEAGTAIQTSLNVTATPTVVTGSIDVAITKVRTLAAELRSIPGLAEAARARVGAAEPRVDFDGLHADTTHPGF